MTSASLIRRKSVRDAMAFSRAGKPATKDPSGSFGSRVLPHQSTRGSMPISQFLPSVVRRCGFPLNSPSLAASARGAATSSSGRRVALPTARVFGARCSLFHLHSWALSLRPAGFSVRSAAMRSSYARPNTFTFVLRAKGFFAMLPRKSATPNQSRSAAENTLPRHGLCFPPTSTPPAEATPFLRVAELGGVDNCFP